MNPVRFLIPFPLLQISIIYFAFSGEASRIFIFLSLAILLGLLTFHFTRKLSKNKKLDWFLFLYPSFITTGIFTLPIGLWFLLYFGESLASISIPFLIILPTVMSFFELYYILRAQGT
jgi:hypothetical protein